jgi:DNA-binding NtrC family response regulator
MSEEFKQLLKKHRWTGNIRELKNAIERAVLLSSEEVLTPDLLPEEIRVSPAYVNGEPSTLDQLERQHIIKVLKQSANNKTQAAKTLGIGTATLYRKLKEYGIE